MPTTEEQIQKCYKCQEEYCPVWSPFGEPIDAAISLKTFTNEFVKAWVSHMENEPIPCLTHDDKCEDAPTTHGNCP